MKGNFVVTGTVTYAIKGRDILRRFGFAATLKRVVNSEPGVGCGYGIVTNCDIEKIKTIFLKHGIRYLKIIEDGVQD